MRSSHHCLELELLLPVADVVVGEVRGLRRRPARRRSRAAGRRWSPTAARRASRSGLRFRRSRLGEASVRCRPAVARATSPVGSVPPRQRVDRRNTPRILSTHRGNPPSGVRTCCRTMRLHIETKEMGHDDGVPEGDTIFRAATQLRAALVGKEVAALEIRRDPRGRRAPEAGTTITAVDATGKHLLIHFSDGQVLHTHMQMTGAWHVYRPAERWRRPGHSARVVAARRRRHERGVLRGADRRAPPRPMTFGNGRRSASRMLDRLGPDLCVPGVDLDAVTARLARLDPSHRARRRAARPTGRGGDRQRLQVGGVLGGARLALHADRGPRRAGPAAHLRDRARSAHEQPHHRPAHDVSQRPRRVPPGPSPLPALRHDDQDEARRDEPLDLLVPTCQPEAAPST